MLDSNLRQAVASVQQGQDSVREDIIKKYLPFILKVTSQSCRRYVRLGVDDEVSVALMAFDEALHKYEEKMGASFLSFAEAVIKRRLIDYFRKESKECLEIPLSALIDSSGGEETGHRLDKLTWEKAKSLHFEGEINKLRFEEIKEYQEELLRYGITLKDLVEASPKHHDARKTAFAIACRINENMEYKKYLQRTKSLPLKELEQEVNVSRKTMERQRKYIIALAIILMGKFYFLEDYLQGMRG